MRFENKVAVVTGAARGLGQHYALRFAEEGARVVVCDLDGCDETVSLIEKNGGEALNVDRT